LTDEYDETHEEETGEETTAGVLPDGVIERLTQYASRTKQELKDVVAQYLKQIEGEHGCTNPAEEDEDLLIDWAEQMFIDTRNAGSGGSVMAGSVAFVGHFVGVDEKRRDRRANLVARAKRDFTLDPNAAISSGMVGHYTKESGYWKLGDTVTETLADEIPEHSFVADGERICLLAKSGRPKGMSMMGRNYHFLGAAESDFTNDGAIQLWRLDMQGEDADAEVLIGEPCRIMARPPSENAKADWKDVLNTSMGMAKTIQYTDDFVNDAHKSLLQPFKFWTDMETHSHFVPLEDLADAFESGSRTFTINGEQGRSGPIVLTKGTVNRMSTESRENKYDEDNRGYSITLTSTALQSQHGNKDSADVMGWMGSACHDLGDPFNARTDDELIPYAERSTVLVCGRISVKRKDGIEIPSIKVMGVFADSRRIRRRQTGGDTGEGQFN
jgi:hypothetical protein